jgi:hypothetical protein
MMMLVQTNYKRQKRFNELYTQQLEIIYAKRSSDSFSKGYQAGYEHGVADTTKGDSANGTGETLSTVWRENNDTKIELLREVL